MNLMAETRLKKAATRATKGWKSKKKKLEEHVGTDQN